jgi:hypothetical protein
MLTYAEQRERRACWCLQRHLCWRMLTYADVCWAARDARVLMPSKRIESGAVTCHGRCWRMLTYADVCWRMLMHADVCWRMYADVCRVRRRHMSRKVRDADACWRMLTYADVSVMHAKRTDSGGIHLRMLTPACAYVCWRKRYACEAHWPTKYTTALYTCLMLLLNTLLRYIHVSYYCYIYMSCDMYIEHWKKRQRALTDLTFFFFEKKGGWWSTGVRAHSSTSLWH